MELQLLGFLQMGIWFFVHLLVLGLGNCIHLVDFPSNLFETLRQLLHCNILKIILFVSGFGFCLTLAALRSEVEDGGGSGCLRN